MLLLFRRSECEAQVKGFTGAIFKKFKSTDEANQFIEEKGITATAPLTSRLNEAAAAADGSVGLNRTKSLNELSKLRMISSIIFRMTKQLRRKSGQPPTLVPHPNKKPKSRKSMKIKPPTTHQILNR